MEISNDQIRDISVKVVEGFLNEKVPLTDGIVKCASELELNSDQIKRVIESSNTIAYLKLQKEAEDKTFEFPVAEYNQVMAKMCFPEKQDGTLAEAEFVDGNIKQASETNYEFQPEEAEFQAWVRKEYYHNKAVLEKIAYDKQELAMNIGDAAERLRRDPLVLEKLAMVCDEETYSKLSHCFEKKAQLETTILRDRDLEAVSHFVGLFKKAEELLSEEAFRKEFEKKAFAGAIVKGLGSAAGATTAGVIGGTAKATFSVGKAAIKQKVVSPIDVGMAALRDVNPASNVWDNLQGTQKRF